MNNYGVFDFHGCIQEGRCNILLFKNRCCSRISASVRPLDRSSKISLTGKRKPRIVGLPPISPGCMVILSSNNEVIIKYFDVSGVTIGRYLDLMTDLLLVRRLKPWTSNIGKRLVRSPKIYVRDSGITHALLNIPDFNSLLGHPVVGGSWEGFVIENILAVTPSRVQPYYYATPRGEEVDLVLEFPGGAKWAIEIKRSSSPSLSKGFHTGCEDIKADKRFVVYSGKDRFSLREGITAISLPDLMQELLEQ